MVFKLRVSVTLVVDVNHYVFSSPLNAVHQLEFFFFRSYFYSFHGLRAVYSDGGHSASQDLMLAAVAGVINVVLTTPMWVVNTRMKMQGAKTAHGSHAAVQSKPVPRYKYKSIAHGLVTIFRYI